MVAYIGVAPLASARAAKLQGKTVMASLDIARARVVVAPPCVGEAWQV